MAKRIVLRGTKVHAIYTESDGWPDEPFIEIADATPCNVGDVWDGAAANAPASAGATRVATDEAAIATLLAELDGKSIAAMTAAEQRKLLAILCRKNGIRVRP